MLDVEKAKQGLLVMNMSSKPRNLMTASTVASYLDVSLNDAVEVLKYAVLTGAGRVVASGEGSMIVERCSDDQAARNLTAINASVMDECSRIQAKAKLQ